MQKGRVFFSKEDCVFMSIGAVYSSPESRTQMQDIPTYQAERRSLSAANGRLHVEIWRRLSSDARIVQARKEIAANEHRMRTIEYLICWLHGDIEQQG